MNPITAEGLRGVAHGFFTREGGVSGGIYASLNGGLGSGDEAARSPRTAGASPGGWARRISSRSTRCTARTWSP